MSINRCSVIPVSSIVGALLVYGMLAFHSPPITAQDESVEDLFGELTDDELTGESEGESEGEAEESTDSPDEETTEETDEKAETTEGTEGDDASKPPEDFRERIVYEFRVGKYLNDQGKFAEALDHLTIATAADARFVPALYEQGRAYGELGYLQLAVKWLSKAAGFGQNISEIFGERGAIYLKMGKYREALQDLEKAVELRPSNPEFLLRHGSALTKLAAEERQTGGIGIVEKYDTAKTSLDRAIEVQESNNLTELLSETYFERGLVNLDLGDLDEALHDFRTATELEPTNVKYISRTGFVLYQQSNSLSSSIMTSDGKAKGYLEEAITSFTAGLAILEQQAAELAEEPAAEPDIPEDGAATAESDGQPQEAEEPEYDSAEHADLLVTRASALIALADMESEGAREEIYLAAIADCKASLDINPEQPNALYTRGLAERMLGNLEAAIDAFSDAISLSPAYGEALFRRAIVYFRLGDADLALMDLRAIGSSDPRIHFWTGVVNAEAGNYDAAVQSYSEAIRGNRDYRIAFVNRGLAYLFQGEHQRAVNDFNEALRRNRRDADSYFRRGIAYENLGKVDQAASSYRHALRWNPGMSAAQSRLNALQ